MGAEERGSFRIGMQDAAAGWGCGDGEEEGGHGAVLAKKPPTPPRARSLCPPVLCTVSLHAPPTPRWV